VCLREYASRPGALLRALAPNAYGAYLIHIVPVVVLQQALAGSTLPPLAKFAGVVVAAVPASFLIAAAIRAIPGLRRAV
jgi:peptidoglycan/LPS O-acetylase OafA/YrhL